MDKKRHLGTKARVRAIKEREKKRAAATFLAVILLIVIVLAYLAYRTLNPSPDSSVIEPTLQFKPENPNLELKAAIVDHLSLNAPNQTFTQAAATILTASNYTVDYFDGEKTTVDFYRNLPTLGYRLIILRVHSALDAEDKPPLALFTSEPLDSRKHVNEQLTEQVLGVSFLPYEAGDKVYFGIMSKFIRLSMLGQFQDSVVIAMGCDGLTYTEMALAFLDRGVRAYIGWNGSVSASHTDHATIRILQHLVTEGETIRETVQNTIDELGPDPYYHSTLEYYPLESGKWLVRA